MWGHNSFVFPQNAHFVFHRSVQDFPRSQTFKDPGAWANQPTPTPTNPGLSHCFIQETERPEQILGIHSTALRISFIVQLTPPSSLPGSLAINTEHFSWTWRQNQKKTRRTFLKYDRQDETKMPVIIAGCSTFLWYSLAKEGKGSQGRTFDFRAGLGCLVCSSLCNFDKHFHRHIPVEF